MIVKLRNMGETRKYSTLLARCCTFAFFQFLLYNNLIITQP